MYEILSKLPFANVATIENRQSSLGFSNIAPEKDFQVYVSTCHRNRSLLAPEESFNTSSDLFRLVYVVADSPVNKTFFRYKFCEEWWDVSSPGRSKKTCQKHLSSLISNNAWKALIYEKMDSDLSQQERDRNVTSVFGQDKVFCDNHALPLSCDFPKNSYVCQFDESCYRKSAWRCPSENCESALCKSHFEEINEKSVVVPHGGKNSSADNDNEMSTGEVEEVTDNELDGLETENIALLEMPTDAGFVDDVELQQTDAGAESVHFHSNDDLHAVGSHVILNAVCALLNRPRNPTNFRKKEWRFLQSFVAKCPGESVPLTFPEAALLPSIYYIMAEQSICGAVPAPLFSPSLSKRFNFADIISHIKNRLKDFSVLTSTDPRVIQFYFDCFLNFQAQYCDTRFVLNRGLQEFRSQESEKSEARVRMNEEDSRKVVNELAAAIRSEEPTFFLTFTLNQSRMFGVAPLYRLVEKNVRNLSASKRKNIIEGFMPLYMRL